MSRLRTIGLLFVLASAALAAQPSEIRLASLTPDGSVWDKALRQLAADWTKASGGSIAVKVFPTGQLGDDREVVTKIQRLNSPQAAALTVIGLSKIDPAFNVFAVPFFYASFDELYDVMDKMTPTMVDKLDKQGFVFLAWGHGGWAQVFTTTPVKTVADVKKLKLFTSAGDEQMVNVYRANGFTPRALEVPDILTSLGSGLIDGMPVPATAALSYQWFRQTKYMLDIGVAPVIGALVISKKTWTTIPEAAREKFMDAARAMETKLKKDIPVAERTSIEEMKKRGLTVLPATGPEWKALGEAFARSMLSTGMVPKDMYDTAVRERDAYRQRKQP